MFRNDVVAISPAFPYSAIIESRQSLKKTVESDSKHRKKEKFQKFDSIRQEKRLFDLSKSKITGSTSRKEVQDMLEIIEQLKKEVEYKTSKIDDLQSQIDESISSFQKLENQAKTTPPKNMMEFLMNQVTTLELKLKNKETKVKDLKYELSLYEPEVLKEDFDSVVEPTLAVDLRYGISAEDRTSREVKETVQPKAAAQVDLIRTAMMRNMFFRELDPAQVDTLIGYMEQQQFKKGSSIITEGEQGKKLYVLDNGNVEVFRTVANQPKLVANLHTGAIFGELAILYNCKRTATVIAKTDVQVWSLDRMYFQVAIRETSQLKRQEYLRLLKTVSKLKALSENKLMRIADCLIEAQFNKGDYIIRQGDHGDTFYIIKSGKVAVKRTKVTPDQKYGETLICYLQNGEYFGEAALLTEERRTANVVVESAIVTVLMLDRNAFHSFVGSIPDLDRGVSSTNIHESVGSQEAEEDFEDSAEGSSDPNRTLSTEEEKQIKNTPLKNLQVIRILGQGGFGCVKLVLVPGLPKRAFALKSIRKAKIVKSGQEKHIVDEKTILMSMKSPFIGRLYRTYKDELKVYLLMDAYLGGELYHLLKAGPLPEDNAKFCSASVLEALDYLHIRAIAYRDMKPENLMIDHTGYIKLVDFGFAKYIKPGFKTYTFCGTPEYFPPEILANKGHDTSADIWSFGILVYELLSKTTPFLANSDMQVYENILGGIEGVRFHKRIPRSAENLIRNLCRLEPRDRLGYQKGGFVDVRKHRWYQGFNWQGLRHHQIESPLQISVSSPTDTKNFEQIKEEKFDPNEDKQILAQHTRRAGWDASF